MKEMTGRSIAAFTVAAAGILLAVVAGAGLVAASIACLAGILAVALFRGGEPNDMHPGPQTMEQRERLPCSAELINAVATPLMVVREGQVLLANKAARKLLGDHIEGGDVRLAIRHPAAAERLTSGSALATESDIELVGLGDIDSHWTMTVTALPPDSQLVRLIDLSGARAIEQMRADFVANASHELRTPLASLMGFLEVLEDEATAEDQETRRRFLTIMSQEARRMHVLIEDLMSLSRIEADRFASPREPVDLLPLITSVFDACRGLSDHMGSELSLEVEAGSTLVAGDHPQLAQLFNNLVTNALNYGRAGCPVRVEIKDGGSGLVRVSVIDQGEGIEAEHIPRLTERFYRVDPGRSRAGGGTGLGLAIAKHVVQRHRGRLQIDSKIGEGTSVSVFLPFYIVEDPEALS